MSGVEFTEFFQNLWYDLMNPGQANIIVLVIKVLFVLAAFLFTPFRTIKTALRKRRRKKESELYNQRRNQELKEQKERQELAEAERQRQKERDILLIKEHLEIKIDE